MYAVQKPPQHRTHAHTLSHARMPSFFATCRGAAASHTRTRLHARTLACHLFFWLTSLLISLSNTQGGLYCEDGLFLSGPPRNGANTLLFLSLLLWSFLGVAIAAVR